VRASDSRFTEPNVKGTDKVEYSLITRGSKMNTTALNQCDHCIDAKGGQLEDGGNLTLVDCEDDVPDGPGVDNLWYTIMKLVTPTNPFPFLIDYARMDFALANNESIRRAVEFGGKEWLDKAIVGPTTEAIVEDLRVERDIFDFIEVPTEVADEESVVYGRIMNDALRPLSGVTVVLEDPQGQPVIRAITDSLGSYMMKVAGVDVPLTLSFFSDDGAVLHREVVEPARGTKKFVETKLRGGGRVPPPPNDTRTPGGSTPRARTPREERENLERERREERRRLEERERNARERRLGIDIGEIPRISTTRVKRLHDAGINTLGDVLAATDKDLLAALGSRANFENLREAAKKLLGG
jgi:hypothetical protein